MYHRCRYPITTNYPWSRTFTFPITIRSFYDVLRINCFFIKQPLSWHLSPNKNKSIRATKTKLKIKQIYSPQHVKHSYGNLTPLKCKQRANWVPWQKCSSQQSDYTTLGKDNGMAVIKAVTITPSISILFDTLKYQKVNNPWVRISTERQKVSAVCE